LLGATNMGSIYSNDHYPGDEFSWLYFYYVDNFSDTSYFSSLSIRHF
jgi:hypothetical protein